MSFPRPFILCIHFCRMFWERDEWPSPRESGSLSYPSLRSLLMWLPSMSDLSWSLLPFVLLVSSSFSFWLLIRHPHLTFCFFFFSLPHPFIPGLTLHVHHSYISRYQIIFLHHLIIDVTFMLGTFGSMAHELFYTYCILYMKAWVLIIGYLSLVSFHFYYFITLAYVTSYVLRPPWGHEIRCRLWQPLLGQVFEIWLPFRHCHASSSGRHLSDG